MTKIKIFQRYSLLSFGCTLVLLASLIAPLSHAAVQMLDRVVAIVDLTVITQSELDSRLNKIITRSRAQGINLPPQKILRKQILDQLIDEALQLNAARRIGVAANDQEVGAAIERLMQQQKWNMSQLTDAIAKDGETLNEFQESIRRQLTMQNVSQGMVSSRIKISEQDIDNFLNSADAQFWISPDYHLGHILIATPTSADSKAIAAARSKAEAIYQQLLAGANFKEMAIAESKGPAALQGGDLGWRKSTELPTLFAELAPTLKVGDIAKPTRSQAGFHILKLYEKRGEQKEIVRQTKSRHILIKTTEIVNDDQARDKLLELRQQILDGADFAKLAKTNSEDIGSKLSGGDLGWSNPGMFVPEFEKTMDTLKKNEISQPFKSKFGWHILQVLDRRDEDLTEDMIRNRARSMLMGRRFEDEVQVWLQEMRDEAFIEIKI